ncbi:tripartite motif-containing protein 59-like [Littorina saxatilis]|uniref:Uncharacterized protein n=1 Tax=Littorina saxatilis TaxID=31220 RepID=A0AAN9AKV3_9CAEN
MATGGSDASLPSLSSKREALTCALCLEVFRNPKLLSCTHTFCQKCLEDLVTRHPDGSFPCPSCRRDIQVPDGGASAFQANFYIEQEDLERARSESHCFVHPQKEYDLFCVKCDALICMDCKLTKHLHHESQSLDEAVEVAQGQLTEAKERLEDVAADLERNIKERKADQTEFREKKAVVEREIRQRHATIVATADSYRDEALAALETVASDSESTRTKDLQTVESSLDKVQRLQQRMTRAVREQDKCEMVNVAKEMRSGQGSTVSVEELTAIPRLKTKLRPVHQSDTSLEEKMRGCLKDFIGGARQLELEISELELTASQMFHCGENEDTRVFCLCPMDDDTVWVSIDSSPRDVSPTLKKYSASGSLVKSGISTGRVTVKRRSDQKQIVLPHNDTKPQSFAKSQHASVHYGLFFLNSSVSEFVLTTILCDEPFSTKRTRLFAVNCGPHDTFDVDHSQMLFAVVTTQPSSSQRQVCLFKKDRYNKLDTYMSPLQPFQPADVCFFTLVSKQKEVLLIADECNDVIHVVDTDDDKLTFRCFLGPGNPLLLQPTALHTDTRGRLWVGCRGGRIITFQPSQ